MLRILRYKLYQRWFCHQFIKRSMSLPEYTYYLKHYSKKDWTKSFFTHVAIYDVLDNNGMNKLIKSLYHLKHNALYSIDISYPVRSFKKINYIRSNMSGVETGIIGNIKFKSDKWLSEINIYYTYLNNSEAIIKYDFSFKKIMSTYIQIHEFVMDTIKSCKKSLYFHTYANKSLIKKAKYSELLELDDIFFADILQSYICKLVYTKLGTKYKLPIEYSCKIHHYNHKKANRFRKAFLQLCYERKGQFLLIDNLIQERFQAYYFYSGKYLKSPILFKYFSSFSIEFYYFVFNKIESAELEHHMRKYLNSRKKFICSNDIKWLINKIRYIREQEYRISSILNSENKEYVENLIGWHLFINGEKKKKDLINFPEQTAYFKALYEQNLEYLNSIASVQNNMIVIIVSVATFIATIAGIAITLLTN